MAAEGHAARRNERDHHVISEAAVSPRPRKKTTTSIPYHRLPTARRASRSTPRIVNEAAMIGGPREVTATGRLPDAAIASFGNPIVLEVVIGNDDRVRIKEQDLRRNPFRQICALRIKARTGAMYVGTGWFIGPRAVATAGHCVYMHKEQGWAEWIDVIPAKFGPSEPYSRLRSTKFRTVDGWIDQKRPDLDYGLILLDDTATGGRVGWFEVAAESDVQLAGSVVNISGYPADREDAEFQYFHARPVVQATPTRIEYDIDTFGGQSGSPVWLDTSSGVVAVGVHTTGAATGNSGTRVTEPVIDNFIAWRDE